MSNEYGCSMKHRTVILMGPFGPERPFWLLVCGCFLAPHWGQNRTTFVVSIAKYAYFENGSILALIKAKKNLYGQGRR